MFGALRKALPLIARQQGTAKSLTRAAFTSVNRRCAHSVAAEAGGVSGPFSTESILEFTTFYLVIPIIIWARIHSYYEMQMEINEEPVLPPRYEYLGVIRKKFPWGDGTEPLFGWARGRSPAEYAARKEAGLPMPDLLDDLPEDDDED